MTNETSLALNEASSAVNCVVDGRAPGGGTFGACYIDNTYDSCGQPTGTDCFVYFDGSCGGGVSWGTYPMAFDTWVCVYLTNNNCSSS
jgi:hypothetical protein